MGAHLNYMIRTKHIDTAVNTLLSIPNYLPMYLGPRSVTVIGTMAAVMFRQFFLGVTHHFRGLILLSSFDRVVNLRYRGQY